VQCYVHHEQMVELNQVMRARWFSLESQTGNTSNSEQLLQPA